MLVRTAPEFERDAKRLERAYPQIYQDVAKLISDLEAGPRPRDRRLSGIGVSQVYKARIPNTSARRGTSGGFRVVYRVKGDTVVLLLVIWSKTERADVPDREIRRIAMKY